MAPNSHTGVHQSQGLDPMVPNDPDLRQFALQSPYGFFSPYLKIAGNSIFILLSKNFFSVIELPYQIFVCPRVFLPCPVHSFGQELWSKNSVARDQ